MPMNFSIKHKTIFILFLAIGFSLLLVGLIFNQILRQSHIQEASKHSQEAHEILKNSLKVKDEYLSHLANTLLKDEDIISPVNMVSEYQNIAEYKPIIFDVEKQNLAMLLRKQAEISEISVISAYDIDNRLISFSLREKDAFIAGFVSYRQGMPAIYQNTPQKLDAWIESALPDSIAESGHILQTGHGATRYQVIGKHLAMLLHLPLVRTFPDNTRKAIGSLKAMTFLGNEFVKDIIMESGTDFQLFLPDGRKIGNIVDLELTQQLQRLSHPVFTEHEDLTRFDYHSRYFLENLFLELADGLRIYFVFATDKTILESELGKLQQTIALVFFLSALIFIPIFIFIANKMISAPINSLVKGIRSFQKGEFDKLISVQGSDELSLLGQTFNEMASTIKQQINTLQQAHDNLEAEVAERKQKEKELVKLATAIEQTGESIVVTDKAGTIQYVNPCFEHTTGYSREQAVGQNPRILQGGKHDTTFYKSMWETLANGNTWHGRLTNKKKDGSLYEEEATISPVINKNGTITNYVAVKRDVTDQIKLRKQLSQAQKMEAIGTLAGGIAHDFNNILACILGYSDMILDELPEGSGLRSQQGQVVKAGNRAKELVKQILAFSRQSEQEQIPLAIHIVVKEAIKLLHSSIPTTIEIKENIDPKSGMVLADPTQLHQIVMNLCTNAYHAMRETAGVLAITLSACQIEDDDVKVNGSCLTPGYYVKLEVSDTGCGMDQKTMENIFDPYFTTKKRGEGTGLGLAMVHGIVKTYNGHITVYSELGKGTTFHVYLPQISATQEVETSKDVKIPYPTGTEKILIVDDEEVLVQMERQMLESLGYKVFAHTNSKELLQTFQGAPQEFDLIITDMTMPEMTGIDISRQILAIRPDMPIILCTGFSALIDKEKAAAAGISEYIMKPVVKRDLAKVVRKVLDASES